MYDQEEFMSNEHQKKYLALGDLTLNFKEFNITLGDSKDQYQMNWVASRIATVSLMHTYMVVNFVELTQSLLVHVDKS